VVISLGITGMMMPKPVTSIISVVKMNPIAGPERFDIVVRTANIRKSF
jgi:hypothetical protein